MRNKKSKPRRRFDRDNFFAKRIRTWGMDPELLRMKIALEEAFPDEEEREQYINNMIEALGENVEEN